MKVVAGDLGAASLTDYVTMKVTKFDRNVSKPLSQNGSPGFE
jgi:hypothetical protein